MNLEKVNLDNWEGLMELLDYVESLPLINTQILYRDKEKHMVSIHSYTDDKSFMIIAEGYSKNSKIEAIRNCLINFISWDKLNQIG